MRPPLHLTPLLLALLLTAITACGTGADDRHDAPPADRMLVDASSLTVEEAAALGADCTDANGDGFCDETGPVIATCTDLDGDEICDEDGVTSVYDIPCHDTTGDGLCDMATVHLEFHITWGPGWD